MTTLEISLANDQTEYFPKDKIEGNVSWQYDRDPKKIYVRLFWFTSGKGTEDLEIVNEITFDDPKQAEARPFSFTLPPEPYSFSGKLVSLTWSIELLAKSGKKAVQKKIIVSPYGHEVDLAKTGNAFNENT